MCFPTKAKQVAGATCPALAMVKTESERKKGMGLQGKTRLGVLEHHHRQFGDQVRDWRSLQRDERTLKKKTAASKQLPRDCHAV